MNEDLHIKYRPQTLDDVIGQSSVVKSIKGLKKKGFPHSFIFTGPSGTGKTTIARILAKEVGCDPKGVEEIDAATHTGVESMRNILSGIKFQGFGDNPIKFIVLDEAHMLSKASWNSALKAIEEPPDHVYFAFCTTEPAKIPKTIKTRCHAYDLKPVPTNDLIDLLEEVSDEEGLKLDEKSLMLIARESYGSPRQALVYLSMTSDCVNREEVAKVLEAPGEDTQIIDLCRMLMGRKPTWKSIQEKLVGLKDQNPESIRIMMVNYFSSCILRAKSEKDAIKYLEIIELFLEPFNPNDKMAPLIVALGRIVFD